MTINITDSFHKSVGDREIAQKLVEYAAQYYGEELAGTHINVKASKRWRGLAYATVPVVSNAPDGSKRLIIIRVGGRVRYPIKMKYPRLKTAPEYVVSGWQELTVVIAAHEMQHIVQFNHNRPCSEIECEQRAVEVLEKFRNR